MLSINFSKKLAISIRPIYVNPRDWEERCLKELKKNLWNELAIDYSHSGSVVILILKDIVI